MGMTLNNERWKDAFEKEVENAFQALPKEAQAEINEILQELKFHMQKEIIDPKAGNDLLWEQKHQVWDMELLAKDALCSAQNRMRSGLGQVERKVIEMYPAVDVKGKYCVLDVRAAERDARIDAALQNCNPSVVAYVGRLRANPAAKELQERMVADARKHRLLTLAAERCVDHYEDKEIRGATAGFMRLEAKQLETSQAVMDHTIFTEGLEHIVGLEHSFLLSRDITKLFSEKLNAPLDKNMLNQAKHLNPQKFEVVFENLDNILQQYQLSDPANQERFLQEMPLAEEAPLMGDVALDAKETEQVMASYARSTTDRLLDGLFPKAEKRGLDHEIDRAGLIIVDGKTVQERIYESYMEKGHDPAQFDAYYKANSERLTNDYVAAGLIASKRVEVFVPDKNGKIPAVPAQITRSGYEPSPLQPIAMNAWHRFWAKFGFYKERIAQVDEYQRMESARNRATIKYYTNQLEQLDGTRPYIEKQFTTNIESDYAVATQRRQIVDLNGTKLTSFAACYMLADGYSVEDIFDPDKLQAQKAAAGEELLFMVQRVKAYELGSTLAEGQYRLMKYFEEQSTKVDFTNFDQLCAPQNKTLFLAAITARDIIAESQNNVLGYDDHVERCFRSDGRKGTGLDLENRMRGVSTYLENVRQTMVNSARMVSGLEADTKVEELLAPIFASQIDRDRIKKAAEGMPLLEIIEKRPKTYGREDEVEAGVQRSLNCSDGQMMINTLTNNPEAQKAFGRDMLSGKVQEHMHFDLTDYQEPFKLGRTMAHNRELQQQAPQLKQAAPQNAAKMSGPTL